MTRPLRFDRLQKNNTDPSYTKSLLGSALFNVWCKPEHRTTPQRALHVPEGVGHLSALFKTDADLLGGDSVLCDAFVLPLCWKQNIPSPPNLFEGLKDFAHGLRDAYEDALNTQEAPRDQEGSESKRYDFSAWSIHWGINVGSVDMSKIELGYESAGVSLLCALRLAHEGQSSKNYVFSTGEWDKKFGVKKVEFIAEKLRAIMDLGIHPPEGETLHATIPAVCYDPDLIEQYKGTLEIHTHEQTTNESKGNHPVTVLREHIGRLEAQPTMTAGGFERCLAYANRPWRERGGRNEYYKREILPEIAELLRQRTQESYPDLFHSGRFGLVVNIGRGYEQAVLSTLALKPAGMFAITTPETSKFFSNIHDDLKKYGADVVCTEIKIDVTHEKHWAAALETIQSGLAEAKEHPLIFDVTGGTSLMTLLAFRTAQRLPNAASICLQTESSNANVILYGTESILLLSDTQAPSTT